VRRMLFFVLMAVSMMAFCTAMFAQVTLEIDPPVSYPGYDEIVTLSVYISGISADQPMRGFDMQVNFDPTYLSCDAEDFIEGSFLEDAAAEHGLRTQFYVRESSGAWIVSCAILSVPPGTPTQPFGADGDGVLFSLNLKTLNKPSCYTAIPVTLSNIRMRDELNHDIYLDSHLDAEIYIHPTLVIPLYEGWNLISSWVIPPDMALEEVFKDLREDGYLIKVQDENGDAYVKTLGNIWQNDVGPYEMEEGYYVMVNQDCELIIEGKCVLLPMTVQLYEGWNMIPYPYSISQPALDVLQDLIDEGAFLKVQDENGLYIVKNLLGEFDDLIGGFEEGEGYYLLVSEDTSITFPGPNRKKAYIRSLEHNKQK